MTRHIRQIKIAAILILVLAVGGCVTKPSPPTSFYMLDPLARVSTNIPAEAREQTAVIAVETVRIPAYLDRNQIVTSLDDIEVRLADFNHWAEPLSDSLTRVIAENLSRILSGDSAEAFPAAGSIPYQYSVDLEIMRLDGKMNDQATLTARWAIFGPDDGELIHLRKSEYREAVNGDSYKDLVLAYSRAVEKLCRDIAEVLKDKL